MAKGRLITTDGEIDAALARARAGSVDQEPVAESVRYIPAHDIYVVGLSNGERLVLQREKLQGLQQATKAQLGNVEIDMVGTALSWPDLDVDLYVPALMRGVFGTKKWMSELGRAGGSVKSEAKAQAARANGAKGGRPKTYSVAVKGHKKAARTGQLVRAAAKKTAGKPGSLRPAHRK
jgi:hypothetical protein